MHRQNQNGQNDFKNVKNAYDKSIINSKTCLVLYYILNNQVLYNFNFKMIIVIIKGADRG